MITKSDFTKGRLAIVTSHPIQYNAPIFKLLSERNIVTIKVFYTWGIDSVQKKFDPGFGKAVEWDIPILEGYDYEFLENVAKKPGSNHFKGIDNPGIINRVNAFNPDAILVFGWAFKSHLAVLRYFKGKRLIIFRGDSTLLRQHRSVTTILRKLFLTWVYRHVDKCIYVGKHNYNYYKEFGLNDDQLILAPHAIDNFRFGNDDHKFRLLAAEWRKELGIAQDAFVFVYAGKLETVKHVDLLLLAFLNAKLYEKAHLVIVGNGPLEIGFKDKFGDKPKIHFLPFQNQSVMPAVYRLGDFYVLPSISETWGLAINESFASGIPVIASSACGGASELIDEGINGFIFESDNQESLEIALGKALKEGERYSGFARKAKEKVAGFSFLRIAETVEKLVSIKKVL